MRAISAAQPAISRAGPCIDCTGFSAATMGTSPATTAPNPAENARKLASAPRPPAVIAASNAPRGKGSVPDAAKAPSRLAEITDPAFTASASKSAFSTARAAISAAASTSSALAIPSPGAIFSDTASIRWVEVISTVRSGVTKPRMIARPASISSAVIMMSTSPAAGISENTGWPRPAGAISM